VHKALEIVQAMKREGEIDGWREVIIKLDSDYVAKSLCDYIWTWESNGFMTRKGTPVEHGDLIREMHATITQMEKEGAVRFWRVGREWNKEADALVNQALDDAADSGYGES
jgi:ribonuclease HI